MVLKFHLLSTLVYWFIANCLATNSNFTCSTALDQLKEYKNSIDKPLIMRTDYGVPIDNILWSQTVGIRGPTLLQDAILIENLSRFNRERIPERVVHAKGAGAFGHFEVTDDITKYTKASVFNKIGKQTNIAVRFSLVESERGTSDGTRDLRGFAIKFYTEDGIWDLVGNNSPIFFFRDAMLFPSYVHSQKRNPVTNLKDPNMFWDFLSLRPETTPQVLRLMSDSGIPDGYIHMDGWGSNTFKFQNSTGASFYVKFIYLTDQGAQNLSNENATKVGEDYAGETLYNAIHQRKFPSWTFFIQIMTIEQANTFKWDPFDVTKNWPAKDFPLIKVGKFVLNKNPENYFQDIEQIAFSPANMIPGIEPSPDKMLQGRLFAYGDAQRYRIGANFLQLPVNCPHSVKVRNYLRDGPQVIDNQGGAPNYFPNSFSGPIEFPEAKIAPFLASGVVARYNTDDEDNFSQATEFYNGLSNDEKNRVIANLATSLSSVYKFIQDRAIENFSKVDPELAKSIKAKLPEPKDAGTGSDHDQSCPS